jgi:ABC-type nickel/cobalt efflux system permease component RcnA/ABC-type uncharacterized transport system substrate-binding protein
MSMPQNILALILWAFILCLPSVQTASAHPHVYVDTSLTFVVGENGLEGIRQHWLFDEIFSNAIMGDLGLTPETLAVPMGQQKVREGAFAYLANYDYFTLIETGGKKLPISATDFKATTAAGRLSYDFTVPLNLPFDQIKDFRVAIFDKEYYSDILLKKDEIIFEIDGMAQVSHTVRPAKDHTYWQFIVPEAVHLTITPPGETTPPVEIAADEMAKMDAPGLMEQLMTTVRNIQKELTLKLNGFGMDIRKDPFGSALWMFLAFSFLYGIVHAVGPGHGKTVVCSYFLANPGSFFSGAVMGHAITFVHMGSAAIAVGVAYLIFSTGMGGFAEASRALQPASYALLAIMGIGLTIKAVVDLFRKRKGADKACSHADQKEGDNLKKVLLVSLVTGLIPCPGAAVILAFSIGQNIMWAGILAITVMAIGMGFTTTLFAWGAVIARKTTFKVSSNATFVRWLQGTLSIGGAAFIAAFGAVLFMSSAGWH